MKSRIENLLAAVHAADLTTPDQVEAFRIDFLEKGQNQRFDGGIQGSSRS